MSTDEIRKHLRADFPGDMVKKDLKRDGKVVAYVDAWYVIARANEIFGEEGWSHEVMSIQQLSRDAIERKDDQGNVKKSVVVIVQCHVRVHALETHHDGIGMGVGNASAYNVAQATELAWKAAETDAIKRALKNFGNALGLALYDKEQRSVGDSLAAQEMFRQIEALGADDLEAIEAWHEQNADAIADLSTDESKRMTDAIRAKRSAAYERDAKHRMEQAKSRADLVKAYEFAKDARIERSALERLAEFAKTRTSEFVSKEAA